MPRNKPQKTQDYLSLKEQGNSLFQSQNYEAALKTYSAALDILTATDENRNHGNTNNGGGHLSNKDDVKYNEAVLLSNRSNCQFELGNYSASISDAQSCLALIDDKNPQGNNNNNATSSTSNAENLRLKNLLRLARASFYNGSVFSDDDDDDDDDDKLKKDEFNDTVVTPLKYLAQCGVSAYEKRAMEMLAQVQQQQQRRQDASAAFPKNYSGKKTPDIPIHRASLYGQEAREYYSYGHDSITSALSPGSPAQQDSDKESCPALLLSNLPDWDLSNLAILFGGVGDARHVFATVCDAHKQWKGLGKAKGKKGKKKKNNGANTNKKQEFRMHLTMNDVNPTVLARDLLMLVALSKLGNAASTLDSIQTTPQALSMAILLQYLFFGYVMPPSVHLDLMELIDEVLLDDNFQKYSWIVGSASTWSEIKVILNYWRKSREGVDLFPTVGKVLDEFYSVGADGNDEILTRERPDMAGEAATNLQENFARIKEERKRQEEEERANLEAEMKDMGLDDLPSEFIASIRSKMGSKASDSHVLEVAKELVRGTLGRTTISDGRDSAGRHLDTAFIKHVKAIFPPASFFADDTLHGKILDQESNDFAGFEKLAAQAEADIRKSWRVNPTFFDPVWTSFTKGEFDSNEFNPVADVVSQMLTEPMLGYMEESQDTRTILQEMEFFDCTCLFFWNVSHALTELVCNDHLIFELSHAPVTAFCRDILDQPEQRASQLYPQKFHRIFLSNIPDYIGMLSVFTEIAPALHCPNTFVPTYLQANVLLHTGIWKDYAQYIYSATALPTLEDAENILGFRYLNVNSCFVHQNQWTWTDSGQGTASRDEFTRWLYRLLIMVLLPPQRSSRAQFMEMCTTNVSTFMRVCVYCIEVLGYPRHWVALVLDEILSACSSQQQQPLKTKARIPSESPVIFHGESAFNMIDLSSFAVEIESQIVLWAQRYSHILMPLVKTMEPKDQVYRYQLELSDLKLYVTSGAIYSSYAGGFTYPMVLGFILTERKVLKDDGGLADMLPFGFLDKDRETGIVREGAIKKGAKSCHVFSCMQFHCNLSDQDKNSISFFMSESTFEMFRHHYLTPIRTDSWSYIGGGGGSQTLFKAKKKEAV